MHTLSAQFMLDKQCIKAGVVIRGNTDIGEVSLRICIEDLLINALFYDRTVFTVQIFRTQDGVYLEQAVG